MNVGTLVQLTAARAVRVNQAAIKGEPGTGYEDGSNGPFRCDNCHHFGGRHCNQPDMMRLSKLPKNSRGEPKVDPAGCCEFVERKGRG